MRMDRLTLKAQDALSRAQNEATNNNHYEIQPEHLLKALADQEEGMLSTIAQKIGVPVDEIAREAEAEIKKLPRQMGGGPGGGALSASMRDVLNEAWNEVVKLKDQYMSTEHIILALAGAGDTRARKVLNAAGFTRREHLKSADGRARQQAGYRRERRRPL